MRELNLYDLIDSILTGSATFSEESDDELPFVPAH